MQGEACWAWTAQPKSVFPGVIYGLALGAAPHPSVLKTLARSRSPSPCSAGHLNGDESESSGRLQRLAASRRPRRCPGLQTQVREDLLDHRLLQDGRNDLELAAAGWAMLQVELESEASAKTNLYSSYVTAKTRLSSFAQLSRTGRWCAQFASQSAGGTACAGVSASCGTTSARNLAFVGGCVPAHKSGCETAF